MRRVQLKHTKVNLSVKCAGNWSRTLRLIATMVLLLAVMTFSSADLLKQRSSINKFNYGVRYSKRSVIELISHTWINIFEIQLPSIRAEPITAIASASCADPTGNRTKTQKLTCEGYTQMRTHAMETAAVQLSQLVSLSAEISALVPPTKAGHKARRLNCRSCDATVASRQTFIDEDTFQSVYSAMGDTPVSLSEMAPDNVVQSPSPMLTYTRVGNMAAEQALTLDRRIKNETLRVLEVDDAERNLAEDRSKLAFQLMKRAHSFTTVMKALNDMKNDISSLYAGTLNTNLIPLKAWKVPMTFAEKYLGEHNISLKLTSQNPIDTLAQAAFTLARFDDTLLLAVQIPLSPMTSAMTLYQVDSYSLPVPGQGYSTQITNLPKYLAVSSVDRKRIEFTNKPPLTRDHYLVLNQISENLQMDSQMTCAWALLTDNAKEVIAHCQTSLSPSSTPATTIKLSPESLLLISTSEYSINCDNQAERKVSCDGLCIIHKSCGCEIVTPFSLHMTQYNNCKGADSANITHPEVKYAINLRILQTFFNASDISGDQTFDSPPHLQLPDLSTYQDHFIKLSSRLVQSTIDLKALRHPAEIEAEHKQLISDLQPSGHGLIWYLFDWVTPVVLANAAITCILIISLLRMRSKLLKLSTLVITQGQMTIAQTVSQPSPRNWQFFQTPVPVTTQQPMYQKLLESLALIREIDSIEILQLLTLLTIAGLAIFHIRRTWFATNETQIYLELGTAKHRVIVNLKRVPHDSCNYTLTAAKTLTTVRIEGRLRPKLILDYENVTLTHRHAHFTIPLPQVIGINWFTAYSIYHIIQDKSSFYYLLCAKNTKGWPRILKLRGPNELDVNDQVPCIDEY